MTGAGSGSQGWDSRSGRFDVLIAGGGVAAMEAALSLADLAGDRVCTRLLAPTSDFTLRSTALDGSFGDGEVVRVPIEEIASDAGATVVRDSFVRVDPGRSLVHTEAGATLRYDALLVAVGARQRPPFRHAITLDDACLTEQVEQLLIDVHAGRVGSVALVIPSPMPWPLPIYELALMTARHVRNTGHDLRIEIVTPEDAPLALFGEEASRAVSAMLSRAGITVFPSAQCGVPEPGLVSFQPGPRMLRADRVLALPQLFGPPTPGIPGGVHNGFLAVDPYCRVRGVPRVLAAGDATDFPIKHGSIAAQQADTAARTIAAMAGAPVELRRFQPILNAVLTGPEGPLRIHAEVSGAHGVHSQTSEAESHPQPVAKLASTYLTPYLDARSGVGAAAWASSPR